MSTTDRVYHSPLRQQQADETRQRILDAARALLLQHGFEKTKIEQIAKRAKVSAPTIYATFGSKRGIVAGLLDRVRFGDDYDTAVGEAMRTEDPVERLRWAARIARRIFDAERAEIDILRGAAALSPDLAQMEQERDEVRFSSQEVLVKHLAKHKLLSVDTKTARDVLWSLTTRELYRNLVVTRGWSADRYEKWLGNLLVATLVDRGSVASHG